MKHARIVYFARKTVSANAGINLSTTRVTVEHTHKLFGLLPDTNRTDPLSVAYLRGGGINGFDLSPWDHVL